MRDVTERLGNASTATAVGEVIADASRDLVGYGSLSFTALAPGVAGPGAFVVRSSEFPVEPLTRCLVDGIAAIDRELGGYAASLLSGPTVFDPIERFSREVIQSSAAYRECWRPFRIERQLVASMRDEEGAHGCLCLTRAAQEPAFTSSDLRAIEELRRAAMRALASLRTLGVASLAETLAALSRGFPSPAFLFDSSGRVQWLSDEAILRLELDAVRVGAATVLRSNPALEAMTAVASAVLRNPTADLVPLLRRAHLLRPGEGASARRFCEGGRPLLLVAIERAAQAEQVDASAVSALGMGPTQAQVARLAAEGFSVANIAARLGISESTIRTHLRRAYVKLGVHSRAELAFTLLTGAAKQARSKGDGR